VLITLKFLATRPKHNDTHCDNDMHGQQEITTAETTIKCCDRRSIGLLKFQHQI